MVAWKKGIQAQGKRHSHPHVNEMKAKMVILHMCLLFITNVYEYALKLCRSSFTLSICQNNIVCSEIVCVAYSISQECYVY